MSDWSLKRFWSDVDVDEMQGGFTVRLDSRALKTPAKADLWLPTRALADDVASEWRAVEGTVTPSTMPMTRMANSAIDKVRGQKSEIAELLAAYGETDLLCYRAEGPERLVARQAAAWDPLLQWAGSALELSFRVAAGIRPINQDPSVKVQCLEYISAYSEFQLAAFHDLVTLPGSLVIGFAAAFEREPPEALWDLSRLDEVWQIEQWGMDEEAEASNRLKRQAFVDAARFFRSARRSASLI